MTEQIICRYCSAPVESEPNCCERCAEFIAWSRSQRPKPKLSAADLAKRQAAQAYDRKVKERRAKAKKARKAKKKNRR